MSKHLIPTGPPNQSLKKFFEIYEKMLRDSRSFAFKMTDSIQRENRKPKNTGQDS